jgi:hypothetical protein
MTDEPMYHAQCNSREAKCIQSSVAASVLKEDHRRELGYCIKLRPGSISAGLPQMLSFPTQWPAYKDSVTFTFDSVLMSDWQEWPDHPDNMNMSPQKGTPAHAAKQARILR